jgi:hypothetical protein
MIGAPPILAQAALTKNFDIQNEIKVKDDLDNKPDDEKALAVYVSTLQDLFIKAKDFSLRNNKNLRDGRYEFDCFINRTFPVGQTVTCSGGSGLFWGGFISSLEKISKALPHTSAKDSQQVKVNLVLTDKDFFLKTSLTQDLTAQAEQFYNYYDAGLSRIKIQQINNSQVTIYQGTEISKENNQVLIVTRLPRGSLDELLKNAKAESR